MIRYKKGILKDHNFNIISKETHRRDNRYKNKPYHKAKCYDIFTFDIEVSSFWIDKDNNIVTYKKHLPEEYWNSLKPCSLCYIWQFGINDTIYYGRYLEEFLNLLDELPEAECLIWVHNLAYEFHFLVNIMKFKTVFAKTPHKPMKCVPEDWQYIEFRCSYMLTNLSLAKWGNELGFEKEKPIDYMKLRTPESKLSPTILKYCQRDCEVVYRGIQDHLKRYKTIFDIPLTSTGKVRKPVKDLLYSIPGYDKYIKRQVPTAEIYILLKQLFAGGYTHVNRFWAERLIKGLIEHYDFSSSYPTVMCAYKYPCGKWTYRTDTFIPKDKTFNDYAFIFKLRFKGLRSTNVNTYLQMSKCSGSGFVNDNGRIVSADELFTVCNEYDWMIIKDHYEWDELYLEDSWYCKKDYLPKELIEYILQLYNDKTGLKGITPEEDPTAADRYSISKQYINALYGMSVTDIIQADIIYTDDNQWLISSVTKEDLEAKLSALKNVYHKHDKRYFMSYSWGCWVTSIARYNLWKCIDMCTHDDLMPGSDVLYCDTDSIFCLGHHDFSEYNKYIQDKLYTMCDHYDIDKKLLSPVDPKGKAHPLGIFDKEPDLKEFKALHAKCYATRDMNGDIQITVAGVNKSAVSVLNNDLDNFVPGLVFDKDHKDVHKNLHTYISDQSDIEIAGKIYSYRSGINMRPTSYTIHQTDEYERLIEFIQKYTLDDISDITINKLKGVIDDETSILFD